MRDIPTGSLKCRKMIFIENSNRYLTEEIDIDLIHVQSGCEGGDFDDLDIEIRDKEKLLETMDVGNKILIDCYSKWGKGKNNWWQMFDKPIEIQVIDRGDGKKFELDRYCTGGGWCFNMHLN